jgi:hypothetical protein
MIKSIDFPNKVFPTKTDLFIELKDNKDALIDLKKSQTKSTDALGVNFTAHKEAIKGVNLEDGYIYAVINTTKYMDSHNDVHMDGIWNKSAKEQNNKIYYLADHDMKLDSVIAFPKDVEIELQDISFKDLGVDFQGQTQALIFKVAKEKLRLKSAKDVVNENISIEHSVRMQYIKLALCIDSKEEDFKEEKANWDTYFPQVVNKDKAIESSYFWAVTEAKIYKEGSMVLAGSNDVTPLLQNKDIEAVIDTSKEEPLENTRKNINHLFI